MALQAQKVHANTTNPNMSFKIQFQNRVAGIIQLYRWYNTSFKHTIPYSSLTSDSAWYLVVAGILQ